MKVVLTDVSKRYTKTWVLKKINYEFRPGKTYGVRGYNGSGKSTLMRIIASQLSPTLGKIEYSHSAGEKYSKSQLNKRITFSAPYISLIETLSLKELFEFYTTFRPLQEGIFYDEFIALLDYSYQPHQLIKEYSSGMRQRLALAFAILSETDLILLDEPTSFLDEKARMWFYSILERINANTTLIISSNDTEDLKHCSEYLDLT